MSGEDSVPVDKLNKAAKLLYAAPILSVKEALLAAGVEENDADSRAVQMRVRRKLPSGNKKTLVASTITIDTNSPGSTVSSITTPSTSSSLSKKHAPPPKKKQQRMSSKAKQQKLHDDKAARDYATTAHKEATTLYAAEKDIVGGKSAAEIEEQIKQKYHGVGPSTRIIQKYVKQGLIGTSPLRRGAKGDIEEYIFKTLCTALDSLVTINQINGNGGENTRSKLKAKVNGAVGKDETKLDFKLLDRIFKETAINLLCDKMNSVEQRRILWTTYKNLKMWFENWEHDLEDLGFTLREGDKHYIPDDQMHRIVNLDETCLSLDGSKGNRGGRPEVTFFHPMFPQLGKGSSKSSLTTTMIGGSTAAGEALPPHFQFQTTAQTGDNERLNNGMLHHVKPIIGKFGCEEEKSWPMTFAMNAQGGMDDAEFRDYLRNSIVPLYPDAKDKKGKRVMLKVDSGPGRCNALLLAALRHLGFILYPGVPNTTAVTQETDRNYGPFKTQFRKNLTLVVDERIAKKKSTSLQPWLVCLVVFGGEDPITKYVVETSAFSFGFSRKACLNAWEKIGAAPMTRACLSDTKVRRELGDGGDDNMDLLMMQVQNANDTATHALTQAGFRGDILKAKIDKPKAAQPIEARNSQARIEALAKAKTHGQKFYVTGGSHVTADDMFKSLEISVKEKEIAEMEKVKKTRLDRAKIEQEGLAALEKAKLLLPVVNDNRWKVPLLDAILLHWKGKASTEGKKGPKIELITTIMAELPPPPVIEKWTEQDEAALTELKKKEIDIADTALGRYKATKKRELEASLDDMSKEELVRLKRKVIAREESIPESPPPEEESAPVSLPAVPPPVPPPDTTNPPSEKPSAEDQNAVWVLDVCNKFCVENTACTVSSLELSCKVSLVVSNLRAESDDYEYNINYYSSEFRKQMRRRAIGVSVTNEFIDSLAKKCRVLIDDKHFTSDSVRRVSTYHLP